MRKQSKQPGKKPGPTEERLVIEGDWKDVVNKALKKKKPPEGGKGLSLNGCYR